IPWAHDVADNKGILDFYLLYRSSLSMLEPKIELKVKERLVPIIEGILQDSGYEEAAVNIMNNGLIPSLPQNVTVEVPALVHRKGLEGVAFPDYPRAFAALLRNYTGVYDLTAEAILHKSKDLVIQALLVNPVVPICERVPELVDVMIARQAQWLGYLR
ncbi:MAG TPA: alpha-glucosidase, partial [Rectinema sp.]|nr:alpha-glucosidase [Rectinema sp.]